MAYHRFYLPSRSSRWLIGLDAHFELAENLAGLRDNLVENKKSHEDF